jgi:hypothetical protein
MPDQIDQIAVPTPLDQIAVPTLPDRIAGKRSGWLEQLAGQKLIAAIPTASCAHISLAGIAPQPSCTETMDLQRTSSLHIVP